MKKLITLLILTGCLTGAEAQVNVRQRINFDENWRFHFGHAADPAKDFNYGVANIFAKSGATTGTALGTNFNDSGWRRLNLPHDWAVELPFVNSPSFDVQSHGYKPVGGLFPETSIGWYRKHFTIPRSDSGRRFSVTFDGIFRDANIWVNGFYLGNNESGYVGETYDITDYLNYDRDNVLTVRADASQYEGWFYEGAGIYRHVWLNSYPNTHIATDGVFVFSRVKGNMATVNIETTVENNGLSASARTVQAYLTDRNGKVIARTTEHPLSLAVNEKKTSRQKLVVTAPRLWSLEDPYLYRVVSVVKQGGKVVDSVKHRFGIRTIDIKPNGVFLNGKHVKLKGTNNHQDHAGVGSALPDYLQYYRVRLLKDLGSNSYRASHNAPTPELLDACDSLGMLVMDEQRLLNSSPEYIDQFERILRRDRNHPSVFMWSIGNEEGWIQRTATGRRIAQTLLAKQQELDPTRTSTYAADLPNVFQGVNEVIPVRGFNYRDSAVADYHRDHPDQPIIGTEMGSTVTTRGIYTKDTVRAYVPDQDITSPWWASTAEEWWTLAAVNDYWLGGYVWTGFDYRGEPTPYQWPNINSHFGILDVCGFPKNIYYYYQSWWTDKDVLHISPHWNWKDKEGQPVDVWVNTNADNVELFLNGKSLGRKAMPRNRHLKWSVPYQPGTLEAIAYKKGRKLTKKIETTGEPYEVVITPYKTTIYADGQDATVINVSVVDRQGREVPDASNLIRFRWTGEAKIIGVGNGDPSSHEPDKFSSDSAWQRRLFNGKAQVILKAGKAESIIKFEAQSEGLQSGATGIHSISSYQAVSTAPVKGYKKKPVDKMLGADISFLPQLEARGIKFQDKGVQKDAVQILKDHGFNYVRLRLFHNPAADSGYSPKEGFCDMNHTLQMAKRVKAAGMKLLLDFHYSDYWADPEKQYKPSAWKGLSFPVLKDSLYKYTRSVIRALKAQGTTPDMVQVGNEINHGIIWPEGHVRHLDSLAQLIKAGTEAVLSVDPSIQMMLHVALGGQNDESVFFVEEMRKRNVPFDVIGQSYYPKWHGTLSDLENNLTDLSNRYGDVILVEYSQLKREVADIVFNLPNSRGKGTCIWEPLNTWEKIFDEKGQSNELILIYDEIAKKFLSNK
ncbi:MAG TPA: beta-galactosidase GalA [Chitinophagaceae bacterium]